jgi:hypothetical protein
VRCAHSASSGCCPSRPWSPCSADPRRRSRSCAGHRREVAVGVVAVDHAGGRTTRGLAEAGEAVVVGSYGVAAAGAQPVDHPRAARAIAVRVVAEARGVADVRDAVLSAIDEGSIIATFSENSDRAA